MVDMPVFNRVVMDVINMAGKVIFIANPSTRAQDRFDVPRNVVARWLIHGV